MVSVASIQRSIGQPFIQAQESPFITTVCFEVNPPLAIRFKEHCCISLSMAGLKVARLERILRYQPTQPYIGGLCSKRRALCS